MNWQKIDNNSVMHVKFGKGGRIVNKEFDDEASPLGPIPSLSYTILTVKVHPFRTQNFT